MKTTVTCTVDGQTFRRTTAKPYTHAVVVRTDKGLGVTRWTTRLDLAQREVSTILSWGPSHPWREPRIVAVTTG